MRGRECGATLLDWATYESLSERSGWWEEASWKHLENECSRAGQRIATSIMHTPCGIHFFLILLYILSVLGNATVPFLYIWASEFCLRKITKMKWLGLLQIITKDIWKLWPSPVQSMHSTHCCWLLFLNILFFQNSCYHKSFHKLKLTA